MIDSHEHPDPARLMAWIDEPEGEPEGAALAGHLMVCAQCRREVEGLKSLLAALGAAPATPGAAAFAAQRQRILGALPERRERRGTAAVLIGWRAWWIPTLAAAALAALLVAGPGSRDEAPDEFPSLEPVELPVQAAAQAAADEVFVLADATPTMPAESATPGRSTRGLETVPLSMDDDEPAFPELAEEFARLPAKDQTVILDELATRRFDL